MPRRKPPAGLGQAAWTALDIAAAFAVKSDRLTTAEKRELTQLRKKAKTQRVRMTRAEQARYVWLVRKGSIPEGVPWPTETGPPDPAPAVPVPGEPRPTDPLDRLAKLADLHERGVIGDEEFDRLKTRILEVF